MIYISGRMSGIEDDNYPEFNRVAKMLREAGNEVFNPAEIEIDTTGMDEAEKWQAYMDVCMPMISKCGTIYLLNGWELSRGAKRELARALAEGLIVVLQSGVEV